MKITVIAAKNESSLLKHPFVFSVVGATVMVYLDGDR